MSKNLISHRRGRFVQRDGPCKTYQTNKALGKLKVNLCLRPDLHVTRGHANYYDVQYELWPLMNEAWSGGSFHFPSYFWYD